ncbi:MAG: hypothetical protein C4329_05815 [Chitinophagaceae bacterium]
MHLRYNKSLKTFSRQLRNHSILGEVLLWKQLRAGSLMGYTFNRQKPLANYIVDFYCKPLQLVIEIDGGYHLKRSKSRPILKRLRQNPSSHYHFQLVKRVQSNTLSILPTVGVLHGHVSFSSV